MGHEPSLLTDACYGHPCLQDVHSAVHGGLDGGEGADRRHHGLRDAIQAQRCLGDDAKRALRPHKQVGKIVARRRLSTGVRQRGGI